MTNDLPPQPRSFGNIQPPKVLNASGAGADPFGQAKPVVELYCVTDIHRDGVYSHARFSDVVEALALFQTGEQCVRNGTLTGVYLFNPIGDLVDFAGPEYVKQE